MGEQTVQRGTPCFYGIFNLWLECASIWTYHHQLAALYSSVILLWSNNSFYLSINTYKKK